MDGYIERVGNEYMWIRQGREAEIRFLLLLAYRDIGEDGYATRLIDMLSPHLVVGRVPALHIDTEQLATV